MIHVKRQHEMLHRNTTRSTIAAINPTRAPANGPQKSPQGISFKGVKPWTSCSRLTIILVCLFYGARKGGVALGLLGGIGLVILAFVFKLPPGKPPVDVMLTIIAVVAASATLQASGGLEVLLLGAEKMLRRNPKYISILAPFVTCILTMLCGTGHVVYTMLPIIYDIAIKNNIRPERPMAAASVASQMGILASPVSVAVVSLVAFLAKAPVDGQVIDFIGVLSITIPATLTGVLAIGIFSWFRGKDLDKDEAFQALIADPEKRAIVYGETGPSASLLGKSLTRQPMDGDVDLPRRDCGGGHCWARSSRCAR